MAATPPRRSGRAARLQRVAHRRTRTAPRRAAAPIGSRPPGRRRRTAGPASSVTRQPVAAIPVVDAPADRWTLVQQAVGTLAALGTLAVLVFTWLSLQQVDTEHALTREGQVTDRYNAAVGNIGDDALEVRLGGIYALQRIMEDSPRDQPSIISVLSTYVRNHAKKPKPGTEWPKDPPSDIQAALTALGSRNPDHDGTALIALHNANLTGANLRDAGLTGANLTDADLTDANLYGADLRDAGLTGADLTGANLYSADLTGGDLPGAGLYGADLGDADLTGANLYGANLRDADLTGAYLTGANLRDADLTGANLRDLDLRDADLTGADLTGADLTGAER
ncbi:pentapeptide repeat-containing protein [Streptomyces sp. NPDC127178]|uniref:pentapeptide repeat-containing protein n=1 Tax=unclassified Streptomyces TaxID=2593676 RepID=UPI003636D958